MHKLIHTHTHCDLLYHAARSAVEAPEPAAPASPALQRLLQGKLACLLYHVCTKRFLQTRILSSPSVDLPFVTLYCPPVKGEVRQQVRAGEKKWSIYGKTEGSWNE